MIARMTQPPREPSDHAPTAITGQTHLAYNPSMAIRVSKSVDLGHGFRLNLSNRGVGLSAGRPGLRVGVNSRGATRLTVGVPGTGVRMHATTRGRRVKPGLRLLRTLIASRIGSSNSRAYASGLIATVGGGRERAFDHFEQVRGCHSATLLAAWCAPDAETALALLRKTDPRDLPGRRLCFFYVEPAITVGITPAVSATVPVDPSAHALLLSEQLQALGDIDAAIEALDIAAPSSARTLALAELYAKGERWADVVSVTDELRNTDDISCESLVLRARALCALGSEGSALAALKEALRSTKRNVQVVLAARYERGLVYEACGEDDRARKEFESVHALDADYRDVAARIHRAGTPLAELPAVVPPSMRVRDARRRAGMTQRELSKASGIGQQAISRIETGAVRPKAETVKALLKACGVS